MTTANQVADEIIRFCNEHGDLISNLKLQKLLYYTQAWHLAIYDKPLFQDDLEAWVHGPVVNQTYHKFKCFAWGPITSTPRLPKIPKRAQSHLEEVMAVYGRFSGYDLERMVHQEEPWKLARGGIPHDEPSRSIISHESMRSYYQERLNSSG